MTSRNAKNHQDSAEYTSETTKILKCANFVTNEGDTTVPL